MSPRVEVAVNRCNVVVDAGRGLEGMRAEGEFRAEESREKFKSLGREERIHATIRRLAVMRNGVVRR